MQIVGYATWRPSGKTDDLQELVVQLIEWFQGTRHWSPPVALMDVIDLLFVVIWWLALFKVLLW